MASINHPVQNPMQQPTQQPKTLRYCFPSSEISVRRGLASIISGMKESGIPRDALGSAEIILAEVLNNVVEHSYGASSSGKIEVFYTPHSTFATFLVIDDGTPMPNKETPQGICANIDVPKDELPEGGFGWFLIKTLAQDVEYKRETVRNVLSFCLHFGQTPSNSSK